MLGAAALCAVLLLATHATGLTVDLLKKKGALRTLRVGGNFSGTLWSCPAGTYSIHGERLNIICLDCPLGQYADTEAHESCKSCPAGRRSTNPRKTGRSINCTDCAVGTSGVIGSGVCTNCAPGKYAPVNASEVCLECRGGYFSTVGMGACVACPAGKYAHGSQPNACVDCPEDFWTMNRTGAEECVTSREWDKNWLPKPEWKRPTND